ncbi:GFA family protein [Roseomonas sp. KE0001]|uniref:GFA family protein n=1 Tax=unclassified Roseomonas TaxID=2617492 RepID=UPI0018DFAFF0|nr:GFA family protein [Roseomonas sp. KE0001]MBI0433031.1 GFA family protein [Roseomonas sp. KE0001]
MLTGGCLCGAIRYEAGGTPFHATLCHCASCRRAAGAPVVAWFSVARRDFRCTTGRLGLFESSPGVWRGFCAACGTSLTYRHDDLPDEIDITIASLDDPGALPPADHTQAAERLPWLPLCDGRPAYPGGRSEG